ncbi:MAG: O-methyltransferase [Candidatus Limnocylindria bacterium]
MTDPRWDQVDDYLATTLIHAEPALEAALEATRAADMPMIAVSAAHGKWLHLQARAMRATRILEVGTLGGYSTIWLASALPPDGRLVTLDLSGRHAEVARANLERAGVGERVDIRVGPADESMAAMIDAGEPPFDLCFIDADKGGYPTYFRHALALVRPGGLIVADNVVRGGRVADPDSTDPNVVGVRAMLDLMAAEPRVSATVVQTVGAKGYDGFALAIVEG